MRLLSGLFRGNVGRIPAITAEAQDPKQLNLVFEIAEESTRPSGSRELFIRGKHRGRKVAVIVVLSATWVKQTPPASPGTELWTGTVTWESLGSPSDALLAALDQILDTRLAPHSMRARTAFSAISLSESPTDSGDKEIKLKLIYEPDPETGFGYVEFLTVFDPAARRFRIREQDEAYRESFIHALVEK